MADLKGWRGGGGETTSGAQGWERTHCGGFYGVELIFMQLKEAKKRQKPWEGELTRFVLIFHAGLARVCTWHYQATA